MGGHTAAFDLSLRARARCSDHSRSDNHTHLRFESKSRLIQCSVEFAFLTLEIPTRRREECITLCNDSTYLASWI